jgi:hypothetical protein
MGEELVQIETVEYIVLVALGIMMVVMINSITHMEKFNSLTVDDASLVVNSIFILKEDLELSYDLGNVEKQLTFEDGKLKTYINDPLREREGLLLLDGDYEFNILDAKTSRLDISKKDGSIRG